MKREFFYVLTIVVGAACIVLAIQAIGTGTKQDASKQTTAQLKQFVDRAEVRLADRFYKVDMDNWHQLVAGCERTKKSNAVNARGWRAAQAAREASYKLTHEPGDLKAIKAYDEIATDLESRAGKNLDCKATYPKPVAP